jgi:hypothetical protein
MPDFWCVVVVDDGGDGWIIRQSTDCRGSDLMPHGQSAEDNCLDMGWAKDRPPGVYRLTLRPWSHTDYWGEHDFGIDAAEVVALYALPAVETATA